MVGETSSLRLAPCPGRQARPGRVRATRAGDRVARMPSSLFFLFRACFYDRICACGGHSGNRKIRTHIRHVPPPSDGDTGSAPLIRRRRGAFALSSFPLICQDLTVRSMYELRLQCFAVVAIHSDEDGFSTVLLTNAGNASTAQRDTRRHKAWPERCQSVRGAQDTNRRRRALHRPGLVARWRTRAFGRIAMPAPRHEHGRENE